MNKKNHHRTCVLLSSLLFMVTIPVQAAIVANSVVIYEDPSASGTVNGPAGNISTVTYINPSSNGLTASGYGQSGYGAIFASASATSAILEGGRTQTRAQGDAYWIDQLTYNSTTLTGAAYARASFSLSGGLASYSPAPGTGYGTANSTVSALVAINGSTVFSTTGQLANSTDGVGNITTTSLINRGLALNGVYQVDTVSDLTGTFWFDIPFVFGTSFTMLADVTAFAQALYAASAFSDFAHSAYWGGISEVHLADGTVLTDYSLSSASGTDWSNAYTRSPPPPPPPSPAPEPGTVWLLCAGLLGLFGFRRGGKYQPQLMN